MGDDFFEEDDTIFGSDEALDYIILEETEKELDKKHRNAGCFGTILLMIPTFGGFVMLVLWVVG